MKFNAKKLKRNADIGDRLDLGPVIVMVVSLFGIGIFYAVFRSGANIAGFAVFFFGATFAVSFILYAIGRIHRRSAEKMVFNYEDEVICGVVDGVCRGGDIQVTLDLSIKKEAIVFTFNSGNVSVACDLTPAGRLPSASILFIAVGMGAVAANVKKGLEDGKKYNNVAFNVIVNDSPSPAQYLVKDGVPDEAEMARALRVYKSNCRKYKKRKK